ncbi:unnamed protein product [Brassica rapa]|uniref:Replication factor A C-terminal domain-containing protein n=1 Tax=Brassica campestris TaxID=3711 RepID=A0A8D9M0J4_BRACM|nr:unnamed protein product [Brassica rapa]
MGVHILLIDTKVELAEPSQQILADRFRFCKHDQLMLLFNTNTVCQVVHSSTQPPEDISTFTRKLLPATGFIKMCGSETGSSSTSFSDLDVQKIESVTLSELNAYVVNSIPQCYRKLQHGFTSFTCAWCNEEKAVRDLGYFKYKHHQGVLVNNNRCESGPNVEYAVTAPPLQAPTVADASSMEDRARTEENEMQSRRARSDHLIFWR